MPSPLNQFPIPKTDNPTLTSIWHTEEESIEKGDLCSDQDKHVLHIQLLIA